MTKVKITRLDGTVLEIEGDDGDLIERIVKAVQVPQVFINPPAPIQIQPLQPPTILPSPIEPYPQPWSTPWWYTISTSAIKFDVKI